MKRFTVRNFRTRNELFDNLYGTIIGDDGGEPEDQTLTRDFSWVADELNLLSEENERLREVLQKYEPVIRKHIDVVDGCMCGIGGCSCIPDPELVKQNKELDSLLNQNCMKG